MSNVEHLVLKQLMIHCYNLGYSVKQTQDYIRIKKGVTVYQDTVYKARAEYVNNDGQWLIDLALDKTAFVNLFHQKLQHLESYRRSLLDLITPDPSIHGAAASKVSATVHVQAIGQLHKITMSIAALEKMLPLVSRFSKDMNVEDLMRFNKAWEDELNPKHDIRGGDNEPAGTLRPEYVNIQNMVQSVINEVEKKKLATNSNNPTTIPTGSPPPTFSPVL